MAVVVAVVAVAAVVVDRHSVGVISAAVVAAAAANPAHSRAASRQHRQHVVVTPGALIDATPTALQTPGVTRSRSVAARVETAVDGARSHLQLLAVATSSAAISSAVATESRAAVVGVAAGVVAEAVVAVVAVEAAATRGERVAVRAVRQGGATMALLPTVAWSCRSLWCSREFRG